MRFDIEALGNLLVLYGIKFVVALVVAVIGWTVAGLAARMLRRLLLSTPGTDATVATFLSSLGRYAILVVTFLVILQLVGIQATSLVAVLGAVSLAIGLALQGTLSNMAAGVMLLLFRPFRLGDVIEVAGKSGTVRDLNLFMTELAGGDNVQVLIPNGQVWGSALTNFSAYPTRSVTINVPIPLDAPVDDIAAHARSFALKDPRTLKSPPPAVTLTSLGEKTVGISVLAWSHSDDAGGLRADLMRELLSRIRSVSGQDAEAAHPLGA
jgi:small conductance mechanosensitive channel